MMKAHNVSSYQACFTEHDVTQFHNVKTELQYVCRKQKVLPRDVTKCWWASTVLQFRLFFKSQIRRVLSSDADKAYFPLGWKTIPRTQLSCPTFNKQLMALTTCNTN